MEKSEFRAWRARLNLTQNQAAARLGRHPRQVQTYDKGAKPLPCYIRLAMKAIEHLPKEILDA
jgi:DNA-binding XRE family transcriptional regulator